MHIPVGEAVRRELKEGGRSVGYSKEKKGEQFIPSMRTQWGGREI